MYRNKICFFCAFIFLFSTEFLFSASKNSHNLVQHKTARCQKGSASDIDGNIVVISIFADDVNTTWGNDRVPEYAVSVNKYLEVATDWIKKSVKKYGANPIFTYDYFKVGGIYYKTKFTVDLTDWQKNDAAVWKYIEEKIDLKWIKKTYKTDNILFMVHINTDKRCEAAPATRSYFDGMPYPYEIVYMNKYRKGWESSPSSYAHEILHCFGAKDLYYADIRNGFSDEFVDYCARTHKNDIMLTISDVKEGGVHYDKITNELTDLDAYYLGLKNHCKEIEKFSLPKSEHF